MPWETGFAGLVLDRFPSPMFDGPVQRMSPEWDSSFLREASRVSVPEVAVTVSSASRSAAEVAKSFVKSVADHGKAAFLVVARKREPIAWTVKDAGERSIAMSRWKLLIEENTDGSRLGRLLVRLQAEKADQELIDKSISDSLESKACSTLLQRSGSILLYSRWLKTKPLKPVWIPIAEPLVYDYLSMLKESKAAATKSSRFLEALNFAGGTIGADGVADVATSTRCSGSAVAQFKTKQPHRQMDAYTVLQVEALEKGVFTLEAIQDRVQSGNVAALINIRGRFSDTHRCRGNPLIDADEFGRGYFELRTCSTKTSNRRERLRRLLPMVGILGGLTGTPWVQEWIRLRQLCGLEVAEDEEGPLFRAVTSSGTWSKARLRTQEATLWTEEIFVKLGVPTAADKRTGTHSAKCVYLSWLAMCGYLMETRRILGYHASGAEQTQMLYARDCLAGPLRALDELLSHVRSRRFQPDVTRSGRWSLESEQTFVAPAKTPLEVTPADDGEMEHYNCAGNSVSNKNSADCAPGELSGWPVVGKQSMRDCQQSRAEEDQSESDDGFGQADLEQLRLPEDGRSEIAQDVPESNVLAEQDSGQEHVAEMLECAVCAVEHKSLRTLWSCSSCGMNGCSSCLPVYVSLGRLTCDACWFGDEEADGGAESEGTSGSSGTSSEGDARTDSSDDECGIAAEAVASFAAAEDGKVRKPAGEEGNPLFQHRKEKTIHRLRASGLSFACGRKFEEQKFRAFSIDPAFSWPLCKVCFGN